LDSSPKLAPNDIAVNIVTSLPIPGTDAKPADKPKAETVTEPVKEAPKLTLAPEPKLESKSEPKPETKVEAKPSPTPNKAAGLGLAAGEEIIAAPSNSGTNTATNGSGKYVIQIGAFASEERAKGWITKLKEQKIPNYVLNKNASDGSKLYVLRAGPYADKDSAETAEKKIKAMGLSPRLVETGKQ
jgi:DedD protein